MPNGRNGIESAGRKGMAAQQAPYGKRAAVQRSVRGNRHLRVLRAGGYKLAACTAECMQRRRKPAAIKSEDCEQNSSHDAGAAGG